ncbi:MAG: phage head-tail adapter protein [Lachnospiraceae bacterium]|nr:phage head-tail adapter protein [Lachnospiraceae bacterium]
MNKEWSELCKNVQNQIKREETFQEGIETLLKLRQILSDEVYRFKAELDREEFNAMPFLNADGYHSKTIAYSIWHIFRIEDIVANTLVKGNEQVFFKKNYQERIGASIITTGNELVKQQIANFSRTLDLQELYQYLMDVKNSTDDLLKCLSYKDLKRKMTDKDKAYLKSLEVVSTDERAYWLIDYWCGKDVRGLIQMPFSRHWIMHIEACIRIKNKMHPD